MGWIATANFARAENPYLTEALQAYDKLRLEEALRMLDEAMTHPGTTEEEFAKIRMYRGIVYFILDNKKQAEKEFKKLLLLDHKASLPETISPKIVSFFEAIKRSNPPPVPPVEPPGKPSRGRIWTWMALGVGAAALAGGITFGVLAMEAEEDFKKAVWAPERARLKDLAETRSLVANILYGTGGAVLAAAVVLFFVEGGASPDDTRPSAGLTLTPAGFGLQATFRF